MFKNWIDVLTRPKETFAKEKANSSIGKGVANILVASIFIGILISVVSIISRNDILGVVFVFVITIVVAMMGFFISNIIYYVVAKLLGGKGNFEEQFYLTAIFTAPLTILAIFSAIPLIGMIVEVGVTLYMLYLLTLAIKEVHNLSTIKAILVWLIPIIVIAIVIVGILVGFGFLGFIPSMAGTLQERNARTYWNSAYPAAIKDYKLDYSGANILIENIGDQPVILKSISFTYKGEQYVDSLIPSDYKLTPGEDKSYLITSIKCTSGAYEISNISIMYDVYKGIRNQNEIGDRPLIGTCG